MKRIISNIVLFCGGVNVQFLRDNCDNERHKFYPIGLGVIITTLLGFISMMFATHSIFGADTVLQEVYLILFSLFWGFAIFTIDWGLVKTMKKPKTEDNSWGQWVRLIGTALFRLAVAVILSYSISRPLEVKIYEQRLNGQIARDRQEFIDNAEAKRKIQIKAQKGEVGQLTTKDSTLRIQKLQGLQSPVYKDHIRRDSANTANMTSFNREKASMGQTAYTLLHSSVNYTHYTDNLGTVHSQWKASASRQYHNLTNVEIPRVQRNIQQSLNTRDSLQKVISAEEKEFSSSYDSLITSNAHSKIKAAKAENTIEHDDSVATAEITKAANIAFDPVHPGLITELESLSNFEKTPEGKSAGAVRLVLLLVIICIDTSPIVVKLLTKRGVYEEMVEADEDRMRFLSKQESLSNKFLIKDLALAQKDILSEAVKQWRKKERGREDLGDRYIDTNGPDEE
jgi:hypothetical protein